MAGEFDASRRLRNVEDRLQSVWERAEATAATVAKKTKEHDNALLGLAKTQESIKSELAAIKKELSGIRRELGRFAGSDKLAEIEAYLSYIDPMKFVTRDEVRKLIKESGQTE